MWLMLDRNTSRVVAWRLQKPSVFNVPTLFFVEYNEELPEEMNEDNCSQWAFRNQTLTRVDPPTKPQLSLLESNKLALRKTLDEAYEKLETSLTRLLPKAHRSDFLEAFKRVNPSLPELVLLKHQQLIEDHETQVRQALVDYLTITAKISEATSQEELVTLHKTIRDLSFEPTKST